MVQLDIDDIHEKFPHQHSPFRKTPRGVSWYTVLPGMSFFAIYLMVFNITNNLIAFGSPYVTCKCQGSTNYSSVNSVNYSCVNTLSLTKFTTTLPKTDAHLKKRFFEI